MGIFTPMAGTLVRLPKALSTATYAILFSTGDFMVTSEVRLEFDAPLLAKEGERFWLQTFLLRPMPWFLLVAVGVVDAETVFSTTAVPGGPALAEFLEGFDLNLVTAIVRVAPSGYDGRWSSSNVTQIMYPFEHELAFTGPLLYSFSGNDDIFDDSGLRVSTTRAGRRVLISLPK